MSISTPALPGNPEERMAALQGDSPGQRRYETLRDGTPVLIRPLRADDRDLETAFIRDLSPKTRRRRFLHDFKHPSEALIDQLMDVDDRRRVAFIALIVHDDELREIGVSRYSATSEANDCECAVTVADDWHNRGLGTLLMHRLIETARGHGFKRMISVDAAGNLAMRDLAKYLGFERQLDPADLSQAIHTLAL